MNFLRQSARSAPSLASRAFSTSSAAGSVARMTLVGRVGSDPEIKELPSGVHVAEYSVAANNFKDKTSWFKVSVFGEKDIEFLRNYVRKGSHVYVEAEASYRTYESEGKTVKALSLYQRNLRFVDSAKKQEASEGVEE